MFRFIEAVLVLVGMIIGVGMFGIPFSFAKAGFIAGTIELVVIAGIVLLLHILYAELILHSSEKHRLPGFMRLYHGNFAAKIAIVTSLFGTIGSLLAYVLVGSQFLQNIFGTIWPSSNEAFWAVFIALVSAVITRFPLKKEALINGILTVCLVGFILFVVVALFPKVSLSNFETVHFNNIFLPYGILLFALSGSPALYDLITLLGRRRKPVLAAITVGTLIPAVLYFFFAYVVVGVAGKSVSQEAIAGLHAIAGERMIVLGSVVGFFAMFTSLLGLSSYFRALLEYDFKFPKDSAWLVASFVPLFFYFLGFQNFIVIISAVGIFAGGIEAALIIAAYHKLCRNKGNHFSWFSYAWKIAIYFLIVAGVLFEVRKLVG